MRNAIVILLSLLLTACNVGSQSHVHHRIGISQCSEDIWRDWQNAELKIEANFHKGVELHFASALDDSQRQIQQIDSLVASGIDLLIVAPNQLKSVSPAIDRAYDRGIPVIVFERKTDSQKYTAFVSADNYEMGRQMGQYVATRLGGKGNVMEILGLRGSSPAADRHKGFHDAIAQHPNIHVTISLQGDWTEETAYQAVRNYKGDLSDIDFVFGHNDRTAIGARRAFLDRNVPLPMFCGIDGLPGPDGGIRQVRDSLLTASYIYPTRGDQLLQLALDILEGRPYNKETHLTSALVTSDNANVLLLESDEVMRQAQKLEQLDLITNTYLRQLTVQRTITVLACSLIGLLLLAILLLYLYHRGKVTLRRERVVNNLWNIDTTAIPDSNSNSEQTSDPNKSLFIARFREAVEAQLGDSNAGVDELAAYMNLSRVQLYRRVKNITGQSPVEMLRTARLNRGYQLLLTTDRSVSEIAYQVGFTSPSYFTKCFKDEYGQVPGDIRKT